METFRGFLRSIATEPFTKIPCFSDLPFSCVLSQGVRTVKRAIVGFHLDEENDWVADLDCGHRQHVRHNPPWTLRPWVITEAGRAERLGETLECKKCDEPSV